MLNCYYIISHIQWLIIQSVNQSTKICVCPHIWTYHLTSNIQQQPKCKSSGNKPVRVRVRWKQAKYTVSHKKRVILQEADEQRWQPFTSTWEQHVTYRSADEITKLTYFACSSGTVLTRFWQYCTISENRSANVLMLICQVINNIVKISKKLGNLLDRRGRERWLLQASKSNFGVMWPWSSTSWPQKLAVMSWKWQDYTSRFQLNLVRSLGLQSLYISNGILNKQLRTYSPTAQ